MDPNNPYGQQPQQPQQPANFPPQPQGYQPQPAPQNYAPQPPVNYPTPSPEAQQQLGSVAAQYPVDYLNQIATAQPVKKLNPFTLFGAIAGVIILAGIAMFMLIQSAAPPSANAQLYGLQARIETLDKITAEQSRHLTQSGLSSMNSTIGTMLKSMNTEVSEYMKSRGTSAKDKAATAAKNSEKTYAEELSTKFNDAYLTGTLDRVYASEMVYQLGMLKSKMLSVKAAAKSNKYNEIHTRNVDSLDRMSERLSSFQNTK